ncbi:MAG: hypothetical protein F9K13_06960 [Candidatus Methylomirabilis oxygeniifera]|uniref:HTH marR-type domain-containing protein n=1 Tax=Methylomirabilis oxygeniifera TaxID=671143 RepID=D5MH66_METO1|nr:MAG: hypothetical protein F9K13_06960 [Candidatus Methylomirabilis oxyfera]CBE69098.1 protein of unknown function [Candidatus Methylomirabilis oxyfera]
MKPVRLKIFISSIQKEFKQIRLDLKAFLLGDAFLHREAGLPEPQFEQRAGSFVITLWRDWLTAEVLASFHLNERQLAGLALLGSEGRLTSGRYQEETRISRQTATRDLDDMVKKGILEQRGERRGAFYVKAKVIPQL